jgi:hypothetical protein
MRSLKWFLCFNSYSRSTIEVPKMARKRMPTSRVDFAVRLLFLLTCCKFHQHFTRKFFVRKQIEQLFSSYVWLCNFLAQKYRRKLTLVVNFTNMITRSFYMCECSVTQLLFHQYYAELYHNTQQQSVSQI